MENRELRYLHMESMQRRPLTLGEILLRDEREERPPPPPRNMGRTMSPTRCMGPLAIGRPRRARGRILRTSPASTYEQDFDDFLPRPSARFTPTSNRWHVARAEARLRNYYTLTSRFRREVSAAVRPRPRSQEREESPDLFYNPFSWYRRDQAVNRRARARSAANANRRPRALLNRRTNRFRTRASRGIRMLDLYNSRDERLTTSYSCLRASRPHSGRPDPETRRRNDSSENNIPDVTRRFIDFVAEFIPVRLPPPDAEPPEWSLNVTAADFGPFAIGRSAVSRARSLAMIGALSQIHQAGPNNDQSDSNEE